MPLPLIIPAALSLAQSIPNWIAAYNQNKKANQLQSELKRPDFEIPEAETRALELAKNMAGMTRLPGQSGIEGRLDQTTANQVNTVERMGPGGATSLNAASQAYGQQQQKENELGVAAAENWNHNQLQLQNQLQNMSEWEYRKFKWDKQLPYENKADAIRALREGSMRNESNAANSTFGSLANYAYADHLGDDKVDWTSLFGGKTQPAAGGQTGQGDMVQSTEESRKNPFSFETAYPLMKEFKANRPQVMDYFNYSNPR